VVNGEDAARERSPRGSGALNRGIPQENPFYQGQAKFLILKQLFISLSRLPVPKVVKTWDKHNLVPFDEPYEMEMFCKLADCSLFTLFNCNKKRPNNLTFGHLFSWKILKMYEFSARTSGR
jgi:hypothetical protein